jgi:O-antigen ligase
MSVKPSPEKQPTFQGKAIAVVALLVTSVFWSQGTDPFNLPKLFLLSVGSFLLLGSLTSNSKKWNVKGLTNYRSMIIASLVLGLFLSYFFSGAPSSQMIYGAYGRNTGLLCYLSLGILYFASTRLEKYVDIVWSLKALGLSFIFVTLICFLEIAGLNPQGINENIKMSLIGTFGNSNFVSAFMGMSAILFFTLCLQSNLSVTKRLALGGLVGVCAFLILETDSRQGLVVLFGGCFFILGIYLFKKCSSKFLKITYISLFAIASCLSIAGLLRVGPLADLIYKNSVSYRFEYWKAGIEMFKANPITGVGLNSYGDWYRFYRSEDSLVSPGIDVFTNTAHNVYIDLAATGGVFLVMSYLLIILVTLKSVFSFVTKNKEFDVVFYALFGAWVVYLVQASISIDQIGLAIWGWILPGLIFSYERMYSRKSASVVVLEKRRAPMAASSNEISPLAVVGASLGLAAGIVALSPAVSADFDLRNSYDSTSAQLIMDAANQRPADTSKSASIASALLNNNLAIESLEIAKRGLDNNPMSFDLWKLVYSNPKASIEQRKQALQKMMFIDPRNPNLDFLKING